MFGLLALTRRRCSGSSKGSRVAPSLHQISEFKRMLYFVCRAEKHWKNNEAVLVCVHANVYVDNLWCAVMFEHALTTYGCAEASCTSCLNVYI